MYNLKKASFYFLNNLILKNQQIPKMFGAQLPEETLTSENINVPISPKSAAALPSEVQRVTFQQYSTIVLIKHLIFQKFPIISTTVTLFWNYEKCQ